MSDTPPTVVELERRVRTLLAQNETLYALVRAQRDELDRLRPIADAALNRPTIDQARGALGWLLSHHFGDEGDVGCSYEHARDILGGHIVDQLAAMMPDATPNTSAGER